MDKLSESRLVGVNPKLVNVIHRAFELYPEGFTVREGLRTLEQQKLNVKNKVSKTLNSKHLTGDAVDLYPKHLPDGWQNKPLLWLPLQMAVKKAGDELGVNLRFGLSWKSDPSLKNDSKFYDAPHVELV